MPCSLFITLQAKWYGNLDWTTHCHQIINVIDEIACKVSNVKYIGRKQLMTTAITQNHLFCCPFLQFKPSRKTFDHLGIEGLEPSRLLKSTDFKSVASANSAIFPTLQVQIYIALKLLSMQDSSKK